MKTLSDRQSQYSVSLLDRENTSARKRGRRMYHRVMSGLEKGGSLRLVTLTTRHESQNESFQRDFRRLRMRLLRRSLLLDYIRCPEKTKSGLRHEHILFRGSYIHQAYLSHLWEEIHGAKVVDIRKAYSKRRVASYLANYVSKQSVSRYSYSWGWVWRGFARSWAILKRFTLVNNYAFAECLRAWQWSIRLNIRPEDWLPIPEKEFIRVYSNL